jgi:hypothetical protein
MTVEETICLLFMIAWWSLAYHPKLSLKTWSSFLRKTPFLRSLDQTQSPTPVRRRHSSPPSRAWPLRAHGRADARCPRRQRQTQMRCDASAAAETKQNERPNGSQKDSLPTSASPVFPAALPLSHSHSLGPSQNPPPPPPPRHSAAGPLLYLPAAGGADRRGARMLGVLIAWG